MNDRERRFERRQLLAESAGTLGAGWYLIAVRAHSVLRVLDFDLSLANDYTPELRKLGKESEQMRAISLIHDRFESTQGSQASRRRRLLGLLSGVAAIFVALTLSIPSGALAAEKPPTPIPSPAATLQQAPQSGITVSAAAATGYVKVCTPAKCITILASKYCPVSRGGCGSYVYTPYSGWCSSSIGCATINGSNYLVSQSVSPTAKQTSAASACAASLGLTVAAAAAGGPLGWTIAGVAVTVWGCSTQ